LINNYQ